jgi:hypothetical protein
MPFGRPRRKWEGTTVMALEGIECGGRLMWLRIGIGDDELLGTR